MVAPAQNVRVGPRQRILSVDDDPQTPEMLRDRSDTSVIIADMQMPMMELARWLARFANRDSTVTS